MTDQIQGAQPADLRADFEAAYTAAFPTTCAVHDAFVRDPDEPDEYDAAPTQIAWVMWQAARAIPAPEAWRDHVEDRLRTWKQRTMNKSGDMLALDDFMDSESLEDLIDFVCDEWAEPAAQAPAPAPGPSLPVGWRVQRNEDGSIGLFAPPPVDGESRRTSELFTGKLGNDQNEIVFKLLTHVLDAAPAPAPEPLTTHEIGELAHRLCWRYKMSRDPHHSDTYTFNEDTLLAFARAVQAPAVPHGKKEQQ